MAEWIPWLLYLHLTTVAVTAVSFSLRWHWALTHPARLEGRWTRTLPHINDATLFFSGLGMALILHQYPLVNAWLTAKLSALVAYVVLGALALRHGRNRRQRLLAGISALLCLAYLVGVGLHRSPWSWAAG